MNKKRYTTIDKSDWGDGPWQSEPDKMQWRDEATGLPCLIVRGPFGGLCGYVGLAPEHPAYEKHYDEVEVSVHGGLTFSDGCAHGPEESSICHVPDLGEPDNVWWLGFDCGHYDDLCPSMRARERQRYEETGDPLWLPVVSPYGETYRDLEYVRAETARLAEQLAQITT
jgi:hypothetical protein